MTELEKKDLVSLKQLRRYLKANNNNSGELDVARAIVNDWIAELES